MKKFFYFCLGFVFGAVTLFLWFFYVYNIPDLPISPPALDRTMIDVFRYTLREEVDKKLGVPDFGYTPQMFLEVFPGLVPSDFSGVEANVGYYDLQDGLPIFIQDGSRPAHRSAEGISQKGMETLLSNVSSRNNIRLKETGTLTDIVRIITR